MSSFGRVRCHDRPRKSPAPEAPTAKPRQGGDSFRAEHALRGFTRCKGLAPAVSEPPSSVSSGFVWRNGAAFDHVSFSGSPLMMPNKYFFLLRFVFNKKSKLHLSDVCFVAQLLRHAIDKHYRQWIMTQSDGITKPLC